MHDASAGTGRQQIWDRSVLGRVLKHDGVHEPWTPVWPRDRHTQESEAFDSSVPASLGQSGQGVLPVYYPNTGTPGVDGGVARVSVTQSVRSVTQAKWS